MDAFYLRQVSKEVSKKDYWYECAPIGKEKLRKFVEAMCQEAGISEKKTNHSLHATDATALFSVGVPERLIRDVTGHQSNALHLYERPPLAQKEAVSGIHLQGNSSFAKDMEKEDAGGSCSTSLVQRPPLAVQKTSALRTQQQFSGPMLALFSQDSATAL